MQQPAKCEYELYVGHFRSVALSAVQNVLFLLRNASTFVTEAFSTRDILLTTIQSGRLRLLMEPNSTATSNYRTVCDL